MQRPRRDMPSEIICKIFIEIHAGSEGSLTLICLTSKAWYDFAIDLPFLWDHLHRKAGQKSTAPMLLRLQRTKKIPLHLCFDIAEDEHDIGSFLEIVSANAHRWRSIDIDCAQFSLVDSLLGFTRHQVLPKLEYLAISDNPPFLTPPVRHPLLARVPLLSRLAISSGHLGRFWPIQTLVHVHLEPCHGTIAMLETLSLNRVETLYLGMGLWDNFRSSTVIEFPFMRQLTIQGIPWVTFQVLLDIFNAPLLSTLAVIVELDVYPQDIPLEQALCRPPHVPLLDDFTLTIRHEPMLRHMSGVVFTCGWKLPTIKRFTTNIPFQFLDALYHNGRSLDVRDCGFTLGNNQEIPPFAFPRLRHLSTADPWLLAYRDEIAEIVTFSIEHSLPLATVTVYRNPFSDAEWAELGTLADIHDWGVVLELAIRAHGAL